MERGVYRTGSGLPKRGFLTEKVLKKVHWCQTKVRTLAQLELINVL